MIAFLAINNLVNIRTYRLPPGTLAHPCYFPPWKMAILKVNEYFDSQYPFSFHFANMLSCCHATMLSWAKPQSPPQPALRSSLHLKSQCHTFLRQGANLALFFCHSCYSIHVGVGNEIESWCAGRILLVCLFHRGRRTVWSLPWYYLSLHDRTLVALLLCHPARRWSNKAQHRAVIDTACPTAMHSPTLSHTSPIS